MVTAEVQAETKEKGITTKQQELLKRVVKGFTLHDILGVLVEEYGGVEVVKECEAVKWRYENRSKEW